MPSQNASGFVRTLQLMPVGLLLPWAIQRGWSPARRGGGAGTARTWARSTWRLGTPAWTRGADTASRPAKRAVGHRHHGIPHPRRQVHLSPAINCFNGMPVGWSIGTPPNAVLANSSLLRACSQLAYGEHHWVHSDRGSHYRWPGWIAICDGHGIVRSMTRKGCSPDNSRAEGFFGRLKVESFHGRGWDDAGMGEFMEMPDAYLFWYRDKRRKSDLGYMSPMQFRRSLGPVA